MWTPRGNPMTRARRAGECGDAMFEIFISRFVHGIAIEAFDIRVSRETLQEALARRVAPHELLARGIEAFGMIVDRGVRRHRGSGAT